MYSVGYLIGLPLGNYVKKQFGYVLNSTVHFSKQNKYTKSSINGRTSGIWHEHWVLRIPLLHIVLGRQQATIDRIAQEDLLFLSSTPRPRTSGSKRRWLSQSLALLRKSVRFVHHHEH